MLLQETLSFIIAQVCKINNQPDLINQKNSQIIDKNNMPSSLKVQLNRTYAKTTIVSTRVHIIETGI